jgi:hypothetical protein
MTVKVCVTSLPSVGCTFLDWSILYLSGQQDYLHFESNQRQPVVANPIELTNAHGHNKNHPIGLAKTLEYINYFNSSPGELHSMYAKPGFLEDFVNSPRAPDVNVLKNCQHEQAKEYGKIMSACMDNDFRVIYVDSTINSLFFAQDPRAPITTWLGTEKTQSRSQIENTLEDLFFKESKDSWESLNLTDVWDIRERRALNARPLMVCTDPNHALPLSRPHYKLSCFDLWYRGIDSIARIFDYLELPVDQVRYATWLPIYQQWQQTMSRCHEFAENYEYILEAIVNGWNLAIDLNFEQEVIILHFLIYKYGLNIKSWQLTQFPKNTQELHNLLETNQHHIDKLY